jgi:hypothetical protein
MIKAQAQNPVNFHRWGEPLKTKSLTSFIFFRLSIEILFFQDKFFGWDTV